MAQIAATRFYTKNTTASEVLDLTYSKIVSLSILNHSDGEILVNTKNEFNDTTHFVIPKGGSINGLRIGTSAGAEIFIKSVSGGTISVVSE